MPIHLVLLFFFLLLCWSASKCFHSMLHLSSKRTTHTHTYTFVHLKMHLNCVSAFVNLCESDWASMIVVFWCNLWGTRSFLANVWSVQHQLKCALRVLCGSNICLLFYSSKQYKLFCSISKKSSKLAMLFKHIAW